MIQALPLIESGAADAAGLTDRHLALACASHQAADLHVGIISDWLKTLGLDDSAGALVADVQADSPAAEAGLQAGDVIVVVRKAVPRRHEPQTESDLVR